MKLSKSHVLITGASTGIGKAIAKELIKNGAAVTSFDLEPLTENIEGWESIPADITDSKQIAYALDKIDKPIDIVINNAGVLHRGNITENSEQEYDSIMDVNLKGAWLVFTLARSKLSKNATIVQISSRHGFNLSMDPALYAISKNALMDLGSIIAKTFPNYSVKTINPGSIDTKLARQDVPPEELENKIKTMKSPEELAIKVIELLESDSMHNLVFDDETRKYRLE
ncbi:SDR family oxidoreductase [Candidatus Peregrinibacteria bacterium]|jgi:3-oxoacyl-[acyl-carrier protein] reductase|nr:SDR family oxidoreductase [Candidatus Peregrinibacteria bacterium]MBT3599159.1 SDR family oxidoreductase [Candidatus Peregrinibacteria bacterium]MBT4366822.1 SDR family oxidoreductase [Candidatus Peregrinibacteria bacterium]MBT4586179.1 SDR family oxidoreductase [Candidatus Peregrinibacteria bacterium]MBT6730799.1 SDR family oxidoreductase [Candidatus Peregrinibacteria bacterium]